MEKKYNGNSLHNYNYFIRFTLYSADPRKAPYKEIWNMPTEEMQGKNPFHRLWLSNCKVESNRRLRQLIRCEGGICDEKEHRQMRFWQVENEEFDGDLELCPRWSDWTLEEVMDLMNAYIATMNTFLREKTKCLGCENGYKHKQHYWPTVRGWVQVEDGAEKYATSNAVEERPSKRQKTD